jgi:type II secretion system protein J
MSRHSFQSSSQGFTLIEIVLATAIAAVVLIAVQTVFFGALRLRNTMATQVNASLLLQRTLSLVEGDLSGLLLPTTTLTGNSLSGTFQSTPSTITNDQGIGQRVSPDFYTTSGKIDGWSSYSEVQMVTYYLAPSTDGSLNKDLIRAVTRNLLPAQDPTIDTQVLMTGLADVSFDFFDGADWTDTWDSTQTPTGLSTLPSAIRLRILYPSASGQPAREPIETIVPILPSSVLTQTSSTAANSGTTAGASSTSSMSSTTR